MFQNLDNAVAGFIGLLEFFGDAIYAMLKAGHQVKVKPTVGVRTSIRNFILQSVASQTSKPQSCFIAPSHLRYFA